MRISHIPTCVPYFLAHHRVPARIWLHFISCQQAVEDNSTISLNLLFLQLNKPSSLLPHVFQPPDHDGSPLLDSNSMP